MSGSFIVTEDGDFLVTESGAFIVTEDFAFDVVVGGGGTARQRKHSYTGLFADFSALKKGEPIPLPEAEPEYNPEAEPPLIEEVEPDPVPEWVIPQHQVGESVIVRHQRSVREARQIEVATAYAALAEFAQKRRTAIADHNRRAALLFIRRW